MNGLAHKIMVIEDSASDRNLIQKLINKNFPQYDLTLEDSLYHCFMTLATFRPDILIVDWKYKHCNLLQEEEVFNRVLRFKGLVIIYSSCETREIKDSILHKFRKIPFNFKVIQKGNPDLLIQEIIKHEFKKNTKFGMSDFNVRMQSN